MSEVDLKGCIRVSSVLKRLFPYDGVDEEVLKAKGLIGTNVHEAIKQDYADEFVVYDTDRARAYFESFKKWQHLNPGMITQIPRLYCFDIMLSGECDGLWAQRNENLPTIIDWKCSADANPKMWNMQAHYYWYLLYQNGLKCHDKMVWVHLKHAKQIKKDPETNLGHILYHPLQPSVYEFQFDEKVLSECIDEVNRYWEEYNCAKVVD